MISDEQGKKWLLQKLYDAGWRYLYGDYYGITCLTDKKPKTDKFGSIIPGGDYRSVGLTKPFFSELKINQILNIAEELGIVDWSKIEVDTPIFVRNFDGDNWRKRYFAFFKDGMIYAWECGATSWSVKNDRGVGLWKCAKLAGDTHE